MAGEKKEWKDFTSKEKGSAVGCGFVMILLVFFLFGWLGSGKENDKPKTCNDYSSNAIVMSRKFVEDHLQYAGSSEFPSAFTSPGVMQCNDKMFTYTNWVNAANGFGAKKKVNYVIQLEFLGGEWTRKGSWREVSFIFPDGV